MCVNNGNLNKLFWILIVFLGEACGVGAGRSSDCILWKHCEAYMFHFKVFVINDTAGKKFIVRKKIFLLPRVSES